MKLDMRWRALIILGAIALAVFLLWPSWQYYRLSDEQLARLRWPIGLDLGGREPAETALAIMSEIVSARHGASGGSLVDK